MERNIHKMHIYNGILAGAEKIFINREDLNASNGFPVPDHDTGNNLSYLMSQILKALKPAETICEMMQQVSEAAILGSRGNSGAIFSQFFYGFGKSSPKSGEMTIETMIACFSRGYDYAYEAIQVPVEGTLITAIRSWKEGLKNSWKRKDDSLENILEKAFQELTKSVESTQYTLLQQRKRQSPDAGAKAFLYFIEGFMKMIIERAENYRQALPEEKTPVLIKKDHKNPKTGKNTYQFCTEVLIEKNKKFSKALWEEDLTLWGDSIVFSENDKYARLHIHTNTPSKVVEKMAFGGKIKETKAEDMVAQENLSKLHKGQIALVIDSIADLPKKDFADFVYCLPIKILSDSVSYDDKLTTFGNLLKKKNVSSSQPSQGQVQKFLEPIIKAYESVIVMTVSSKMSGLYSQYAKAIENMDKNKNIHLFDTRTNSISEGLLVFEAIKCIEKGKSAKEVIHFLNKLRNRSKIFVSLPNLKAMVSSGRLNETIGWGLQKIGFLPLITVNKKGEGVIKGIAFSQRKNKKLLYEIIKNEKDKIASYAIVHSFCQEHAQKMAQEVEKILGKSPLYIENISSVVSLFSGVGSVAIGYILKEDI